MKIDELPTLRFRNAEVTFPKILLSADRAEALIRTSLWQYGKEIFRPVPGHTRVRVSQFPKGTETIVLSLAESSDHMSIQNFGRTYPAAAGYTEWMSDVVRIEAFTHDALPTTPPAPRCQNSRRELQSVPLCFIANTVRNKSVLARTQCPMDPS